MIVLGVDTSNYATSVAVVDIGRMEVVCAKKEHLQVPPGKCGLRQSEALFQHTLKLPQLLSALREENPSLRFQAVSVSKKPRPYENSYMPCFLAGVNAATAASAALGCPLVETTHQEGHLAAALFATDRLDLRKEEDCLVFHLSGGTTELIHTKGYRVAETVGQSLDLYAGQAVDRLGVLLGFSFPAGPEVSALAATCTQDVRPKSTIKNGDCHLSGLQNQCERLLTEGKPPAFVAKYCLLSIAQTAIDMATAAREKIGPLPLLCAGGVMSSETIATYMKRHINDIHFVPAAYCGDNAVGVACIGGLEASNA